MKACVAFSFSLSKRLAFTAVFAALCAVGTLLIVLPLPTGYFNAGDVFVLLSGWCLGPLYGSIAAGVGSSIADIISGFAIYAPVTFFIKGAVSATAYFIFAFFMNFIKREKFSYLIRIASAILAETVMVLGYFLYESVLYGFGGGAAALFGNGLQGLCCAALSATIEVGLCSVKAVKEFFPALNAGKKKEK